MVSLAEEKMHCHAPNVFGTVEIGIMSPVFRKLKSFFQEHFYQLRAPEVEEEEDCRYHPMHGLL